MFLETNININIVDMQRDAVVLKTSHQRVKRNVV